MKIETLPVLFYGVEVTDKTKTRAILTAMDHGQLAWLDKKLFFNREKRLVVPNGYECNRRHSCDLSLLRMYHKADGISDQYCKIILYGDASSIQTTDIAICVTEAAYGEFEVPESMTTSRKIKKNWNKQLEEFADKLNIIVGEPEWLEKEIKC